MEYCHQCLGSPQAPASTLGTILTQYGLAIKGIGGLNILLPLSSLKIKLDKQYGSKYP